ncbi:MAG: DUF262 domain-containing HNH endonuclease family protein [Patescibacteria group bacterium]
MINPNPAKIGDILNASLQFAVPKYQREYTWGKTEALEFLEDLKSYTESETGSLYLGTLIFDTSEERSKKIKVVDGQQRLTTVLLLLIACRNIAKKSKATRIAQKIQEKITFEDPTTDEESLGPRLIASESIKDVFEEISKYGWSGVFPTRIGTKQVKRQVNRIKPIYDYFYSEVKSFDRAKLSRFLKAIYEAYVVRIDIQEESEAFSIFERTNARGVDLEASDLLKNYLFAHGVEGLEEIWPQIIENSDGTVLRMFKYFYVAKNGYVSKSDLYKKIRDYGNMIGAEELVKELDQFSRFYNVIRTGDGAVIKTYLESIGCSAIAGDQNKYEKIHIALEGLRLFKISQIYPLIYAAMNCFVKNGGGNSQALSKKLIELFDVMEKYHFVNNAVCDRIGNEVEKLYADFCVQYEESNDFEETTKEFTQNLKKRLATEEEFVSRFVDISYSSEYIPLISYIFDRINNVGLHPGQRTRIFNPDQKVLRKNHNIEHFYPQTPEDDINSDPETLEVVDNIGNLLAISFRTNSKLGNLSPAKKLKRLKNELGKEVQNLSYVREFIKKYEKQVPSWGKKS